MTNLTGSAPGRVNLIGEHLDYNGGRCLPIALTQRTRVSVAPSDDGQLNITSGGLSWSGLPVERAEGWASYVAGVLWALDVDVALTLEVSSDVPIGAGLSSSAALECATAVAVDALLELGRSSAELAAACVRAETSYVGAPTGGLDQTTAMFARAGQALLLDFATASLTRVPWHPEEDGLSLLVVDTRVAHDHAEGGYRDRREECERAAALLGVEHLAHATSLDGLPGELAGRARHVVSEQARVDAFADAVRDRDWKSAGTLMTASHASLRDDFEVSCPELDTVVDVALEHGALGARMTGGGFGGAAIVLVPEEQAAAVRVAVDDAFTWRGWHAPGHLTAIAGPGAHVE
ncbi:MAG: galactokinase [Nocardioidaceae bacterium]|nr:galactokinase [Nocardioidaceae bacterium]